MEIIIKDLKKTFGDKTAVDIPDLTIHSGELLGLVGNNGAGKSTLFRLILDLIKADTGTVRMKGARSKGQGAGEHQQTPTNLLPLAPCPSPLEIDLNVATTEDWDEQLQEFLARFQHFMADELAGQKKLIRTLSAGNKQKVGIMAAMLLHPQVLILDEPFNFLDPSSQNAIKHLLKKYNEETGATILVSSHNLQHTVDISSRIVLLEHGQVIKDIDNREHQAQSILENYFEIDD